MSEDAETFRADVLRVEASQDRAGTTIVLAGEFDMTGTDRVRSCVNEALETHPRSLIVDADGLTFIDSSGLKALLHARAAATDAGVAFRVSEPSSALRWMAKVTGVEDLLADE